MTIRRSSAVVLSLLLLLLAGRASAQELVQPDRGPAATAQPPGKPPAPPAAKKPDMPEPPPPAPKPPGQPVNVRIDVTIVDQRGSATPSKKTVTLLLADGESGSVRSTSEVPFAKASPTVLHLPLDIDATPRLIDGQKVRLRLTLNIQLPDSRGDDAAVNLSTQVMERVTAILESGKSMVVAQSADPVTDRQVTVEAKATIQR
jgi:hypothetical protein